MKQHPKNSHKYSPPQNINQTNRSQWPTTTAHQTLQTRNGPTRFRCGEQGHMRAECRESFATIARPTTTPQKHAESNTTIFQALPTAK